MEIATLTIPYNVEENKYDFSLYGVPIEVMQPLISALKMHYNVRVDAECAPHFRAERAKFIDNVHKARKERGLDNNFPQIFLDFPDN